MNLTLFVVIGLINIIFVFLLLWLSKGVMDDQKHAKLFAILVIAQAISCIIWEVLLSSDDNIEDAKVCPDIILDQ